MRTRDIRKEAETKTDTNDVLRWPQRSRINNAPPFNKQRKEERETAEQTWEEAAESFAFSWAGWKDVWQVNATSKHMECDWAGLLRVTVNKPSQANQISAVAQEPRCDSTFRPSIKILWKRRKSKQLHNKIRRANVQKMFH